MVGGEIKTVDDVFDFIVLSRESPGTPAHPLTSMAFDIEIQFQPVPHVPGKESYGLMMRRGYNRYFYTSDCATVQTEALDFCRYVWHDCQNSGRSDVHANIKDLEKAAKGQGNLFLMHYNTINITLEEMASQWCGGYVHKHDKFDL